MRAIRPSLQSGARPRAATTDFCVSDSLPQRRALLLSLVAVIAAVATVTLLPLVRREVFSFRDHLDYFEPLRYYTATRLKSGDLPLWNPYNASGEPWLANPQTGVFYPPQWLFLVLPFETAYVLFLGFHLALLGGGAALLFARDGSRIGALFAALALTLSGPTLSLLDVQNNLATFAWYPLVLLCASRRARRWRIPRTIAGGAALAMAFLAGEPFLAAIAGAMFAVALFRSRGEAGRAVVEIATSGLIAAALSAVQLAPFLATIAGSDRLASPVDPIVLRQSMAASDWLQLANPAHHSLGTGSQDFIAVAYCGLAVVALAAWGAFEGIRKRRSDAAGWLVLLGCSVVAASAGHLPLVPSMVARLHFAAVRHPSRLVILAALALAALSVEGTELLMRRIREDLRPLAIVALLLVAAADLRMHAQPLLGTMPFRTDLVPYSPEVGRNEKIASLPDVRQRSWSGDSIQIRRAWMTGYLNLYQKRFAAGTVAPVVSQEYASLMSRALFTPRFDLLERLSVGWLITTRALKGDRIAAVARSGEVSVYRISGTLPFAFGFSRGQPVEGVRSVRIEGDRAAVDVDLAEDTIVVLNQQNTGGWEVSVDGKPGHATRAAGLFRAVGVSRGSHQVEWTYRPRSLRIGAAITLGSLASLAAAMWFLRRRASDSRP
jgi:hypothetical protein